MTILDFINFYAILFSWGAILSESDFYKEILRTNIHDLKNYLSSLILYSEFLQEAKKIEEARECSEIIIEKSELLNRHLNALRLLYNASSLNEHCSVKDFLERLSVIFTPLFREKSKVLLFRYTTSIVFSSTKLSLKLDEIFLKFFEICRNLQKNSLLVLLHKVDNGDGGDCCFYFFEENLNLEKKMETIKEISEEKAKEILEKSKFISKVQI